MLEDPFCYYGGMVNPEYVLYIPGMGDVPEARESVPERWLPHGLVVEFQRVDWADTDYTQRLASMGERIIELAAAGKRVSLVGESGGGKTALSLTALYNKYIHTTVTIATKISPYNLHPDTQAQFPNLGISSDVLPGHLATLDEASRRDTLCITGHADRVAAPGESVLSGAHTSIIDATNHVEIIECAITTDAPVIADFLQQN